MSAFAKYCEEVASGFSELADIAKSVEAAVAICTQSLANGKKIMLCGNGGSAADCQHLAAELMGRYLADRTPLAAVALTVDTSALTAIANDYGYDDVFSRQLRGLGVAGDTLIGISTSGNSRNVIACLCTARTLGISTIGLTGARGGSMAEFCDVVIRAPSEQTNHIQEMHIAIGHFICGEIERKQCRSPRA
jgi:D-sedoheptulose 7-phosphate isomerase